MTLFFLAVSIHKFVIAFCMGLELRVAQTPVLFHVLYIFVFAAMSAIGIAVGLAIDVHQTSTGHKTPGFGVGVGTLQGEEEANVIQLN